ncbi:MAG: hypothetical protein H6601_02270 [Flavobacteriales bacterium]|nr:hypothetical protein [Flavobacteriales bacterium]
MKTPQFKNWKKYTFEFLSIFIAVVSAFALNNWNDNRRDRHAEDKILAEIHRGLEKDLEDIQLNLMGHQMGIRSADFFRDLLTGPSDVTDSLAYHYFNLTRDYVSIQNTSGYETLKSKGLELIENDSLRTKIISLYEYDYSTLRKLEEEYFELQFQENYFKEINYTLSQHFQFNENGNIIGITTPMKVDAEKEKLLLTYIWKIKANRNFILPIYSNVKAKVEAIRADIEKEIGN